MEVTRCQLKFSTWRCTALKKLNTTNIVVQTGKLGLIKYMHTKPNFQVRGVADTGSKW